MTHPWRPAPGSVLFLDDGAGPENMWVSHLSRVSLGVGSHNLMSTARYMREFGPVMAPMQSMMRTAIWGGAQALWLLSPERREDRIKRAARVHYYSVLNQKKWLNTFDESDPATADPEGLSRAKKAVLANLADVGEQPKVDQTEVVTQMARLTFNADAAAVREVEQSWRSLGAVAHALPWEVTTHPTAMHHDVAGIRTTTVTASWAELAGELSYASAFLRAGWHLIDTLGR